MKVVYARKTKKFLGFGLGLSIFLIVLSFFFGSDARAQASCSNDSQCPASNNPCSCSTGWVPFCNEASGTCDYYCMGTVDCPESCGPIACGTQTCDSCTEVCCYTGCKPISQGCGSSCNTSAPSNLKADNSLYPNIYLTWTKGANGKKQRLRIGDNKAKVEAGCPDGIGPGTGCAVKENNLDKKLQSYTATGLASGTVYYWRVINYKDQNCKSASTTSTFVSSCKLSPSSLSLKLGQSSELTMGIYSSDKIKKVDFFTQTYELNLARCYGLSRLQCQQTPGCVWLGNWCTRLGGLIPKPNTVSLNPTSDSTYVYGTEVTGIRVNGPNETTEISGAVFLKGKKKAACTDKIFATVLYPGPWWQVVDGDLTARGDLVSEVPEGLKFGLPGTGGYPGVPAYGGLTNLTTGSVSAKGWIANSPYLTLNNKVYNYDYFLKLVPEDVVFGTFPNGAAVFYGYEWYKATGDLTVNATAIGTRRVILFVDGNLTINGNITATTGQGFFMALVKGNITLNPAVTDLQGIFLTDKTFNSGAGGSQLRVLGSVAALGGLALQRDLGNSNGTTPAEVFQYHPSLIFLYPNKLFVHRLRWKEVAP